jgi:hypothetical protein
MLVRERRDLLEISPFKIKHSDSRAIQILNPILHGARNLFICQLHLMP